MVFGVNLIYHKNMFLKKTKERKWLIRLLAILDDNKSSKAFIVFRFNVSTCDEYMFNYVPVPKP